MQINKISKRQKLKVVGENQPRGVRRVDYIK
jgi:hypothetical protein